MTEDRKNVDTEAMDVLKDLTEIEHSIYTEKLISEEYFKNCVNDIKKWDRKELVNLAAHSVPHRLPFKVRFNNFINKVLNTFGNGRTERFV